MLAQIKTLVIAAMVILDSCSDNYHQSEINYKLKKENSMNTMEMKEDTLAENKPIKLKFKSDLNSIEAQENFKLVFYPALKSGENKKVKLETLHEHKAHLIIVSNDLEYFNHVHPIETINGNYEVEFVLPACGKYKLYAEYKPGDYDKITDVFDFSVSGKSKAEKIYESKNTAFSGNEYSVKLLNAENLIAGEDQTIIAEFYKDGRKLNINTFENYLGEKAHAVLISINDKEFMHVHPVIMNENLTLHINPTQADYYRLWLQFKINEMVYTADFVLKAVQSNKSTEANNQHKHH